MQNNNSLPFYWVDAFTRTPLQGNPCAIVFGADALSESQMLAIAKEMNLSETAFVQRSTVANWKVRYFTPEREIPLAGHPTIATTHALVESEGLTLDQGRGRFTLELRDGPIVVEVEPDPAGHRQIVMTQRAPQFLVEHHVEEVEPLFGLSPQDILPGAPIQTVSTGTPMLMIPLKSIESLRKIEMDVPRFKQFKTKTDFFSPHLFCLTGATEAGHTFARHPGTPPDSLEDPFTGSATGCMGAYLWKYGLIDRPTFVAEQGHWMGRPGQANVEVMGLAGNPTSVKVGGNAVTVIRGELDLS